MAKPTCIFFPISDNVMFCSTLLLKISMKIFDLNCITFVGQMGKGRLLSCNKSKSDKCQRELFSPEFDNNVVHVVHLFTKTRILPALVFRCSYLRPH